MPPALTRSVLLLGLLVLPLGLLLGLASSGSHTVHRWDGPPGTVWAGTELRAVDMTSGREGMVSGSLLELRCRHLPLLRTRTGDYWPGVEWRGQSVWDAAKVTYQPDWAGARPKPKPLSMAAPGWLGWCRSASHR